LVWWLIEQVRLKVTNSQQSACTLPHELEVPGIDATGKAARPTDVMIDVDSGQKLVELLARFQLYPTRVFHLRFPNCGNAEVMLCGKINPAKLQATAPPSPYLAFEGSYPAIAGHLKELLKMLSSEQADAAKVLFGSMIKAAKGKSSDVLNDLEDKYKTQALSAVGAMAGSEGARCFGMLAASIMAFDLLKHGNATVDGMIGKQVASKKKRRHDGAEKTEFMAGGWPAVGSGTESLLREIDDVSFFRSRLPLRQTLSDKAQALFNKFDTLLCDFVTNAFERDKRAARRLKEPGEPDLTKDKQHHQITSTAALSAEAKALLWRKVLNHL
jgi:hypothetical protein